MKRFVFAAAAVSILVAGARTTLASVAQVVADFTPKPGRCSRISLVFGSENGLGAM
jgi:hypothetical protein